MTMTTKVKIRRSPRNILQRNMRFNRGVMRLLGIWGRVLRAQSRADMEAARRQKILKETEVTELRAALLSDQIVLKDMDIEIKKQQLRMLGLGGNQFKPENFS